MADFTVPDGVHSTSNEDGLLIVLNVKSGYWHALNTTGSIIFDRLAQSGDLEAAIGDLVTRFPEIPEERVRADARHLVGTLMERGLLVATKISARYSGGVLMALPSREANGLSVVDRLVAVVCFAGALVLLRFPLRVAISVVTKAKSCYTDRPASRKQAATALHAADLVGRHFPGRMACMEQSFTAVLFALAKRKSLDWCLGFSSDPVSFHAWVRAEGEPVVHGFDEPVGADFRPVLVV